MGDLIPFPIEPVRVVVHAPPASDAMLDSETKRLRGRRVQHVLNGRVGLVTAVRRCPLTNRIQAKWWTAEACGEATTYAWTPTTWLTWVAQ